MSNWIETTAADKKRFVEMATHVPVSAPSFFNLASDRQDIGGKFADLSRAEVVQASENAAKWSIAE